MKKHKLTDILKSNKGSTLTMVMIYFSVLFILGVAISSLAVMNYKTKVADTQQKGSFYTADSGLDVIDAMLGEEIESAVEAGKASVAEYTSPKTDTSTPTDNLECFIDEERKREAHIADYTSPYLDEDGNYDEEGIYKLLNAAFNRGYTNYFNSKFGTAIEGKLTDVNNYITGVKPSSVSVDSYSDFPDPLRVSDDENDSEYNIERVNPKSIFAITVTVNSDKDKKRKQVQATFNISIPDYNTPYSIDKEFVSYDNNVLWTKAMVTEGNIFVVGNSSDDSAVQPVTINGDVYAYGTLQRNGDNNIIDPVSDKISKNYGGIVVGHDGRAGKLVVNGNVETASYLHTRGKQSSIAVNGEAYCNSIAVEELEPDNEQESTTEYDENCNITVNGNVNVLNDLKLDGEKSQIAVNGSFYGFSNGTSYNSSSSIIINSDDINNTKDSSLSINGEGTEKPYYPDSLKKGVFIAGTAYINTTPHPYQTGESLSIKRNYFAYEKHIANSSSDYRADNVYFESFDPSLLLPEEYGKVAGDHITMTALRKSKYLNEVNAQGGSGIETGNDNINLNNNVKYSLGATVSGNALSGYTGSLTDNGNALGKALTINGYEYDYHVSCMADPQVPINWDSLSPDSLDDVKNILLPGLATKVQELKISDRFDFGNAVNSVTGSLTGSNPELFYLNANQPGRSMAILGPGSSLFSETTGQDDPFDPDQPTNTYSLISPNLHGIIVSVGDVYIAGEVNFTGVIITKGNIYILDDNPKTFTSDYNINDTANSNYVVKKICQQQRDTSTTQVGDYFVLDIDPHYSKLNFLYNQSAGVASGVETFYKHNKLINISSWKIKK